MLLDYKSHHERPLVMLDGGDGNWSPTPGGLQVPHLWCVNCCCFVGGIQTDGPPIQVVQLETIWHFWATNLLPKQIILFYSKEGKGNFTKKCRIKVKKHVVGVLLMQLFKPHFTVFG